MPAERNHQWDNIKFALIFLVITAHGMELFLAGKVLALYKVVYSFHMPAFIFVTGKFARFDRAKVAKHLILPYFVFQTLYLVFDAKVLSGSEITLQYTTPYWILWYLFAIIVYYLLLPVLPEKGSKASCILLAASVAVALLAGFEKTLGYFMSLSRIVVFAPFFLWGYYDDALRERIKEKATGRVCEITTVVISALAVIAGECYIIKAAVPAGLLYGSNSYAACKSTILARAIAMITAAAWIVLIKRVVPKKEIPIISALGQNTLPVFLIHGFVMRLAKYYHIFHYSQKLNFLLACILALVLILALGNKYVGKAFRKLF